MQKRVAQKLGLTVLTAVAIIGGLHAHSAGANRGGGRHLTEQEMWAARGAANNKCIISADNVCYRASPEACLHTTTEAACNTTAADAEAGWQGLYWDCTEPASGLDCTVSAPIQNCRNAYECVWQPFGMGGYCKRRTNPEVVKVAYLAFNQYTISGNHCP